MPSPETCDHCSQKKEPQTRHEMLPDNRCRVWGLVDNVPLYTSEKPKISSGWGKE